MADDAGTSTATPGGDGANISMMTDGGAGGTGEGGTGGDAGKLDIKGLLGEELAGDRNIAKFLEGENPVQSMAKSLIEAQKLAGKVKIGVPDDKATPEERAGFYKSLGVPDDAKGYEFSRPESIPESAYNEEHSAKWAKIMKDNNVPKAAANALRNAMFAEMLEQGTNTTKALTEAFTKDFGDDRVTVAKQVGAVMQKAIPDEVLRKQIENGINDKDRPAFALALGHVIKHMKETYGIQDDALDGGTGSGKSIEELRAEAQKLMASDAARDPMHKDNKEVTKKINDTYALIGTLTDAAKKR